MEALSWIGFNEETIPVVLRKLNIIESEKTSQLFNEEEKHDVVCECCGKPLEKQEIGAIVPGSKKFYCKKTSCLSEYILRATG